MAKTHERSVAVTVTPVKGDTYQYNGPQAEQFISQLRAGIHIIELIDPSTGNRKMINIDCVCSVDIVYTKGKEYVAPKCDPLFCKD